MDIRKVKKLIEMLQTSDVAEIEIHEGEDSVRISRHSQVVAPAAPIAVTHSSTPNMVVTTPPSDAMTTAGGYAAPMEAHERDEAALEGQVIKSPMVGTFYCAAAPGNPAFVSIGDKVTAGDTLCIIEAMKILNQITSEYDGVVSQILVENGAPVEYDEPLFVIK